MMCCLQQVNENLNFEEQILEAAKSIAAATAALVKAASAAQRELIAQGKVCVPIILYVNQSYLYLLW